MMYEDEYEAVQVAEQERISALSYRDLADSIRELKCKLRALFSPSEVTTVQQLAANGIYADQLTAEFHTLYCIRMHQLGGGLPEDFAGVYQIRYCAYRDALRNVDRAENEQGAEAVTDRHLLRMPLGQLRENLADLLSDVHEVDECLPKEGERVSPGLESAIEVTGHRVRYFRQLLPLLAQAKDLWEAWLDLSNRTEYLKLRAGQE